MGRCVVMAKMMGMQSLVAEKEGFPHDGEVK